MASKMISVSIPEEMLPEIDSAARKEHRSRSELIREALRRYLAPERRRILRAEEPLPDEIEAIEEGQVQIARGDYVSLDDLKHEMAGTAKP